ncbi:MAG: phage tail protein [Rhodocyclales bacterium]|nr:phage tail protein [Rhodocyclales bacterium]
MPIPILTAEQIEANILRDTAGLEPAAAVTQDSDFGIRAAASGAAIEGLYQHGQWISRQLIPGPDTDPEWVELHASLRKIPRKNATAAAGTIALIGTPTSPFAIGVEATSVDGITFVTTEAGTIGGGGTATVAARSVAAGKAGNLAGGTSLTLTSAPSGVQSLAAVVSMSGGTDQETIASLLGRLLDRWRKPPTGGSSNDYVQWAKDVDGVIDASVVSGRRGKGTVDVVISTLGGPASGPLITATGNYIDGLRPITADIVVMTWTGVPVAFTVTGLILKSGTLLADAHTAITAALQAYVDGLNPGDMVVRVDVIAIIKGIAGIIDFNLVAPAANVAILFDATHTQKATLGAVATS